MACNNCCYQKSTLSANTPTSITVAKSGLVPFNVVNINSGSSISFTAGNTGINLVKSGIYLITFDASVAVSSTTAASLTFQIYRKGVAISGAKATYTSSAATDVGSISITTLVDVRDVCYGSGVAGSTSIPITVGNGDTAAVLSNANITVVKLA